MRRFSRAHTTLFFDPRAEALAEVKRSGLAVHFVVARVAKSCHQLAQGERPADAACIVLVEIALGPAATTRPVSST